MPTMTSSPLGAIFSTIAPVIDASGNCARMRLSNCLKPALTLTLSPRFNIMPPASVLCSTPSATIFNATGKPTFPQSQQLAVRFQPSRQARSGIPYASSKSRVSNSPKAALPVFVFSMVQTTFFIGFFGLHGLVNWFTQVFTISAHGTQHRANLVGKLIYRHAGSIQERPLPVQLRSPIKQVSMVLSVCPAACAHACATPSGSTRA